MSLTEFGFTKVQNINSNEEMIKFIERVCLNKDLNLLPQQIVDGGIPQKQSQPNSITPYYYTLRSHEDKEEWENAYGH